MRRIGFVLFCLPLFGGDWVSLFDGKTTTGWVEITGKPFPQESWRVEDGCLHAFPNSEGFQDIRTLASFRSFELELDWKIEVKGNSGVKYFIHKVDEWTPKGKTGRNARARGFEYQLADDANEEVGKDATRAAGSLYSVLAPSPRVAPRIGEFNHTRLVVEGKHVEHWLNGTRVLAYDLDDVKVASHFPNLALDSPISLQNHASPAWFKNIRIRQLP